MKTAIVGSRDLWLEDFSLHLPEGTTEIISGGAKGIDTAAALYAAAHGMKLTEIKPDYRRYRRAAPLKRNEEIVKSADHVLIFWNGTSRGTRYVIELCEKLGKPHEVFVVS